MDEYFLQWPLNLSSQENNFMCACMFALLSDIHNNRLVQQKQSNDLSMFLRVPWFVRRAWLENSTYTAVSLHVHIDLDFPLIMPRSEFPLHPSPQCPLCPTYDCKIMCFITSMTYNCSPQQTIHHLNQFNANSHRLPFWTKIVTLLKNYLKWPTLIDRTKKRASGFWI